MSATAEHIALANVLRALAAAPLDGVALHAARLIVGALANRAGVHYEIQHEQDLSRAALRVALAYDPPEPQREELHGPR